MSKNRIQEKELVIDAQKNPEFADSQKLMCQQDAMETIRNSKSFILIANMGDTTKCMGGIHGQSDTILLIKGLRVSLKNLKKKLMKDLSSEE